MNNNPHDLLDSAFRPFAEWLCELAAIQSGEQVMDLGSGKGISTDVVLKKTLPEGKVFAVDLDTDALRQICKLLKPGGRVAFSVPGALHVKEFRQALMKVLNEMDLRESFTGRGPLVPDNNMLYGWCRSNEDCWQSWSMEKKKITLRCSPDDYLDHMIKRGGAKRILRRLPNDLNQNIWEAIRIKLKDAYAETSMPMTLHAVAMYAKKEA